MVSRIFLIVAGCGSAAALLAGVALPSTHAGRSYLAKLVQRGQGDRHAARDNGGDRDDRMTPDDNGPPPPTRIGVNVTKIRYFSGERMFANLAIGSEWMPPERPERVGRAKPVVPEYANRNGDLILLPEGGEAMRRLTPPVIGEGAVPIRCTYRGSGNVTVEARPSRTISDVVVTKGEIRFTWLAPKQKSDVSIRVRAMTTPIAGLDCREPSLSPTARFDPRFIDNLKRFGAARFMDWQNINANLPVDWATRHTPASIDFGQHDGAPIEDIIAVSNAAGVEPWVNVPWNATDDYVRGFAQLMHDGIPASRQVYVEVSNEVWNWQFPAARQASTEGLSAGLATDKTEAQLLRLAQRTTEVMKIWEAVFRDRPRQLVRVIALQNGGPQRADIPFGYAELAEHVDAIASAPYFGNTLRKEGGPRDVDGVFAALDQTIDNTLAKASQFRAVAARHGKRYIAYEGGQHIVLKDDVALLEAVERDPRMHQAYVRYLSGWRENVGDLVTLYALTAPIGRNGAWGLAEYGGQPLSEAPKMRAVVEELQRRR